MHSHGVTIALVGSYPAFSPLPLRAVLFFCISPAVADCFYIRKWVALCCPDFPLAFGFRRIFDLLTSDKPSDCFQECKGTIK